MCWSRNAAPVAAGKKCGTHAVGRREEEREGRGSHKWQRHGRTTHTASHKAWEGLWRGVSASTGNPRCHHGRFPTWRGGAANHTSTQIRRAHATHNHSFCICVASPALPPMFSGRHLCQPNVVLEVNSCWDNQRSQVLVHWPTTHSMCMLPNLEEIPIFVSQKVRVYANSTTHHRRSFMSELRADHAVEGRLHSASGRSVPKLPPTSEPNPGESAHSHVDDDTKHMH